MSQEYYVAYSIRRTNCFITARTQLDQEITGPTIIIGEFSFEKGRSRTQSLRGAQKLLSKELNDASGKPTRDAKQIYEFFCKLRVAGWTVDDANFIQYHGIKPVTPQVEDKKKKKEKKNEILPDTPPVVEATTPVVAPLAAKMASAAAQPLPSPAETAPRMTEAPVIPEEKDEGSITVIKGDITKTVADALVNAANAQLIPGGGVDGALNKAAGPELAQAMKELNGCLTGSSKVTAAFGIKTAKIIIHAVGPIYKDYPAEKAAELLAMAYQSAFLNAQLEACQTVAVPLLSTGVYGYPLKEACAIAVRTARDFNKQTGQKPLDITFVAFDDAAYTAIRQAMTEV